MREFCSGGLLLMIPAALLDVAMLKISIVYQLGRLRNKQREAGDRINPAVDLNL